MFSFGFKNGKFKIVVFNLSLVINNIQHPIDHHISLAIDIHQINWKINGIKFIINKNNWINNNQCISDAVFMYIWFVFSLLLLFLSNIFICNFNDNLFINSIDSSSSRQHWIVHDDVGCHCMFVHFLCCFKTIRTWWWIRLIDDKMTKQQNRSHSK